MKYIIIYVIISSKGLQIKINIFSVLSPDEIQYNIHSSRIHCIKAYRKMFIDIL